MRYEALLDTARLDDAHAAGLNDAVDINSPDRLRLVREAWGEVSLIRGSGNSAHTITLSDGELGEVLATLREVLSADMDQARKEIWAMAS